MAGRKAYPRKSFSKGVGVLFMGRYHIGEGIELGEGGVAFYSGEKMVVKEPLVVNFQVPGGVFVSAHAEVEVVENITETLARYDVIFTNIQFDSKRNIRYYVSARI
jgi:hypothetical protein